MSLENDHFGEENTDFQGQDSSADISRDSRKVTALFTECRTPKFFQNRAVTLETLEEMYDLLKWGPTSGNCSPARFLFLTKEAEKEAILPALSPGNVAALRSAPVIAAICYDPLFFNKLPRIGSQPGLREWFSADVALSEETAFRNSTLQGGYLIFAARSLGLDVLPMSGFDAPMVEELFLRKEGWRVNFLAGIGYGEPAPSLPNGAPVPRLPRLSFNEVCEVR